MVGPKQEWRLAETAKIEVNSPFYDTDVDRAIGVQAFLNRLDSAAGDKGNPLVFAGRRDFPSDRITRLDQRRKP